jgi:YD repeat protein
VAPTWVKTQDDPWATPASLLDVGEGISITPRATVAFGGLEVMGARVYDPATGSFLSVDPLLAPPEAAWASNPYSYAGNDPVGFSDPTGLAPVSDAQLAAYNQAHSGAISQAWNAASSWVKDNWQYIAAAAVVAVGVGLCITGVGSGLGATILIGAATSGVFSAGTQYITTGKIDPKSLAADIAIGGATAPIGGGVESAVGSALSRTGLCQAGRNILTGAASSAVEGGVSDGLSYLAGPGPHTVGGLASSVGGGAAGGGLTGGATAKITNHMQGLTGWACFTADTPVVMADGSTRPIAQVEVGDRVLAHNPHTGADEAREVLDTPVHEDAVTWRVFTDDGGTVTTTPTHRFWVQGAGWTKAQDLVPGDRLRTTTDRDAPPSTTENPHTDGATGRAEDDPHANTGGADGAVVVESAPTDQTATVHNLTIHGLTNYYIATTTGTRALVHNTYGPTYRDLKDQKLSDAHHIIQDAAVRDLPGYSRSGAPAIQLKGPSNVPGTEHYEATLVQRAAGGGTYAAEREIAERGLRAAGLSDQDVTSAIERADNYFKGVLKVTDSTPTRIPGNRAKQ